MTSTADWYLTLTVFWLAADRGWSGSQLALLVMAGRLPTFLGGTVGGRAVDRFGPRRMILIDATFRGTMFCILTVAGLTGHDGYPVFLVITAACGTFSPISYAACRALIPRLVPQHVWGRANALLTLGDQLPVVLSGALVGPALLFLGAGAYAVPLMLLVVAGALAGALPRIEGAPLSHGEAGHHRARWPVSVVALLALSTFYFFVFGPFPPLLPFLVRENLGGGAAIYALMRVVVGLGAMCGLLLAPRLCRMSRPGVINAVGAIIYGLALFPLVLIHHTPVAVALYFLTGVIWGPYAAVEATAFQQWLPTEQLGRVFGTQRALSLSAIPMGGAIGGLALSYTSASVIMGSSAIACSVVGLAALAFRPLRRATSLEPQPAAR